MGFFFLQIYMFLLNHKHFYKKNDHTLEFMSIHDNSPSSSEKSLSHKVHEKKLFHPIFMCKKYTIQT